MCSAPPPRCKGAFPRCGRRPIASRSGSSRRSRRGHSARASCSGPASPPTRTSRPMHHAPVLWEVAKADRVTAPAYISAQNLRYDDFGAFVERAGIDVKASAIELGYTADPHDRRAGRERDGRACSTFVEDSARRARRISPCCISRTRTAPYRVDAAISSHSRRTTIADRRHRTPPQPLPEQRPHAGAHDGRSSYASCVRLPGWDDTVVLFVSDHGEQFREHGGLYHLSSLFEEQVRVPGWLVAGDHALTPAQRAALGDWAARRTYSQDVNATVLDLLGVLRQRRRLPFADRLTGRSLLRRPRRDEPHRCSCRRPAACGSRTTRSSA